MLLSSQPPENKLNFSNNRLPADSAISFLGFVMLSLEKNAVATIHKEYLKLGNVE